MERVIHAGPLGSVHHFSGDAHERVGGETFDRRGLYPTSTEQQETARLTIGCPKDGKGIQCGAPLSLQNSTSHNTRDKYPDRDLRVSMLPPQRRCSKPFSLEEIRSRRLALKRHGAVARHGTAILGARREHGSRSKSEGGFQASMLIRDDSEARCHIGSN